MEQEFRLVTYDEAGNVIERVENAYDDYGRLIRSERYDGKDVLQDYVVYTYYVGKNVPRSMTEYNADGTVRSETLFDENGAPII